MCFAADMVLSIRTRINLIHVPYKAMAQGVIDLLGGPGGSGFQ